MIHELGKQNSIFNEFLRQVRDEEIQKDRLRIRRNMERLGEIFAYEISKTLDYQTTEVTTSLGTAVMRVPERLPVLATIMRAGLPFHQGFLNYFDGADSAFVSAYRKHLKNVDEFEVKVEYLSSPSLKGKELIIADPMLATGTSMALVHNALIDKGKPEHVHIAALLASKEGIEHLKKNLPKNMTLWIGAIDDELTAQSYIVPGLGDAGDLCYGSK
ncbi:MAG TPA: uracil phosphoribosyltransferase [Cryomorphaceae bacterium]|nr:uracil phosphoribosyltransferase [Cryomorphaceae bacterium]